MINGEAVPVAYDGVPRLEQPGEDVKLKVGDVVVARQIDGGLEGVGLQSFLETVNFIQALTERLPRHDRTGGEKVKFI